MTSRHQSHSSEKSDKRQQHVTSRSAGARTKQTARIAQPAMQRVQHEPREENKAAATDDKLTWNAAEDTRTNRDFRRVGYTDKHAQYVEMCLLPGETIDKEVHHGTTQWFFVVGGRLIIEHHHGRHVKTYAVKAGCMHVVPDGTYHTVHNPSTNHNARLFTIYAVPVHKYGVVQHTKPSAAEEANEKHNGGTGESSRARSAGSRPESTAEVLRARERRNEARRHAHSHKPADTRSPKDVRAKAIREMMSHEGKTREQAERLYDSRQAEREARQRAAM